MDTFKKSLKILHTSLALVLIVYILDVIFTRLIYLNLKPFAILLILPLKILVLSGIYGMTTELASGEKMTLEFTRFKANTKQYYTHVFLVTAPLFSYIHFFTSEISCQ